MSPDVGPEPPAKTRPAAKSFLRSHSLSLGALAIVVTLIVSYIRSDPATHLGSFFGNAIADWTGVLVTVIMTKHLYEKGAASCDRGCWNFCANIRSRCFWCSHGWCGSRSSGRWTPTAGGGRWSGTSFQSGRRFSGWCG